MYDVFLSFRGEDSRAKFMSHLYTSLQNAGIYAFRDDDEIQRGDQISISLLRAIEQSRISIVVLTTNYANSRWCMLELERIMEISKARGLDVVPVFYDVDPSEVCHQEGQFGKAFEELRSTTSLNESTKTNWRRDLFDIGSKAGFLLKDSRNESEDIKKIVERVSRLLDRTELFVAEHPVGVESRVEAATKLLNIQKSDDVLILGIWGMGGMGKTTIAKAIYNQIGSKFEGKSFLLNIREIWETDTNQVSLQQQVLCDVYKTMTSKINDIASGKNVLKEKLPLKRILFVLDDVNEIDQLKALCGSREWFGPGSRVIITTRDMHILNLCRVDRVHRIEEMDGSESLELFCWHAFKQSSPTKDFATHSTDVIAYSGGLPLAIQVLGSYLSDYGVSVWQKVLEKLKCIPHNQVQKKLKVSFDGLKDITEKQAFLDIACFFIGMDRNDVTQILNGCGFFADIGIKVLIERSLVTVDNRNNLQMHDLLRDMGRQIVYEESPFDFEKRSRLWSSKETADGTWDSSLLPCDNIFNSEGRSIAFDLPEMKGRNLKSMIFVVYYSSPNNTPSEDFQGVLIINYTKTTIQAYTKDALTSFEDEDWKSITSNLESGNKVEIMVVLGEGFIVEKTRVSLLYNEPIDKEMEDCNAIGEESVNIDDNIDVPMDDIVTGVLSDDKHGQAMSRKRKGGDVRPL